MSLHLQDAWKLSRHFLAGLFAVVLFILIIVGGSLRYTLAASSKNPSSLGGGYDVNTKLEKLKNIQDCKGSGCAGRTLQQRCEQIFKSIRGGARFTSECCNKKKGYLSDEQCQKDIQPYLKKIPKTVMDQLREISSATDDGNKPTVDVPGLGDATQPDVASVPDQTHANTTAEINQLQSQIEQLESQIQGLNAQAQVLMGRAQAVDAENRACVATCQSQVDTCSATKGCDAGSMASSCQATCDAIETSNHGIIDQVTALAAERNAILEQQGRLKAKLDQIKKVGSGTSSTMPTKTLTKIPPANTKKTSRIFRPVY